MLLTVGIALVIGDLCLAIFGGKAQLRPCPPSCRCHDHRTLYVPDLSVVRDGGRGGRRRRSSGSHRTRLGARVRAGVDDREMTAAVGVDVDRLFARLFVVGAGLAGSPERSQPGC